MDDRTVLRPTPGGRRSRPAAPAEPPVARPSLASPALSQHARSQQAFDTSAANQVNPVLGLLSPLLSLVGKIQHTHQHPDLDEFHRYALDQIRYYESKSWGLDGDRDAAFYVSYALCALIDETVLNTPWGSTSRWGSDSLLINFHQEAWGGEKFFSYLDELLKRPAANVLLLELYHACLALGFEGHFRQQPTGQRELTRLQDDLFALIGRYRTEDEVALSPAWQGVSDQRNGIIKYVPYWVAWSLMATALLAGYLAYSWQINQRSDTALRGLVEAAQELPLEVMPGNIFNLNRPAGQVDEPDLQVDKTDFMALLEPALAAEIRSGVVELEDLQNSTKIRLRHARLFASGRSELAAEFTPLVVKLAELLRMTPTPILVAGHSDNIPIFSARFPSNWDLSKARAKSVGQILANELGTAELVRIEGLADMEPLVPNNSAKNRALNRRVEIVLRK